MSDGYTDLMTRLTIRATSPDHSVTITLNRSSGLGVEVDPARLRHHSTTSLADQLTTTLENVFSAYERGERLAADRALGDDAEDYGRMSRQRCEAFAELEASGTSRNGWIRVIRYCDTATVRVDVDAAALRDPDHHAVADSVVEATHLMMARLVNERITIMVRRLRRQTTQFG